ncbi:MAG TPA: type II toxin-antitoxin system prevent-host-death family antitoxin [Candidatus Baltobacteraceae bacterium]|jgi:prevent-host-death family protein|nr:type II toxin-antitoxin system prevent-host-death family antitoxin [Candidatus Baltobacteraceae bacterium]
MARPREIGAADFKARCLEIMDEVERFGTEVVITKHRKPVARLVPVRNEEAAFCGSLEGMVLKEGDVTSPVGIPWESDEPNLA